MSKSIKVPKTKSWSENEAWFNVRYLEDRGDKAKAASIRELYGFPATGYPTSSADVPSDPHQAPTPPPPDEPEVGSTEWVHKVATEEIVQWVESAENEEEAQERARFALAADADTDAGGQDRNNLKEELEDFATD